MITCFVSNEGAKQYACPQPLIEKMRVQADPFAPLIQESIVVMIRYKDWIENSFKKAAKVQETFKRFFGSLKNYWIRPILQEDMTYNNKSTKVGLHLFNSTENK